MATGYPALKFTPQVGEAALPHASDVKEGSSIQVEPSSLDEVYSQILLRIVKGDLPSGSVLTSTRLATQLNVSRTPIVTVLDRLAADGILQKKRIGGRLFARGLSIG